MFSSVVKSPSVNEFTPISGDTLPSIVFSPDLIGSTPAIVLKSVDFPDPFFPRSPYIVPLDTWRLKFLRTFFLMIKSFVDNVVSVSRKVLPP